MLLPIPLKYAVSNVVGFIKGKTAIHLARMYGKQTHNFVGQGFWVRGYFVFTIGAKRAAFRQYIRDQERADERHSLWM